MHSGYSSIKNTWHFCSTAALSFGSLCTLWLNLATYTKQQRCNQKYTTCLFYFVQLGDLKSNHFLTAVGLCQSSLGSWPRLPYLDDCFGPPPMISVFLLARKQLHHGGKRFDWNVLNATYAKAPLKKLYR